MSIVDRIKAIFASVPKSTRAWRWWLAAWLLVVLLLHLSPQSGAVLVLKFAQQLLAAVVGYQLSKVTLVRAVPEALRSQPLVSAGLTVGRALIMTGAMLAVGLGL